MKVKLFDVNRAQPVLRKLLDQKMPIKVAFKLGRFVKALNEVYESLEAQRVALVEKYGEKLEDGSHKVAGENMVPFQAEFGELLQVDTEVITEALDMNALENIELTALEALALEPFLVEEKS
jgi:hypothetical protein